jgi:hypothetical protein
MAPHVGPPTAPTARFFICFAPPPSSTGSTRSGVSVDEAAWSMSTPLPKGEPPREPGKIVKATVA